VVERVVAFRSDANNAELVGIVDLHKSVSLMMKILSFNALRRQSCPISNIPFYCTTKARKSDNRNLSYRWASAKHNVVAYEVR